MFGKELNKWISAAELLVDEPKPFGKAEALCEYGTNVFLNPVTHSNQLSCKERIYHAVLLVLVLIHPHQSGTRWAGEKRGKPPVDQNLEDAENAKINPEGWSGCWRGDNAAHHGAKVAPGNNCKKFFMECWHSGKLAPEPKGSQACSGMGWDPHLRIPVRDKELSLMVQLLPKEHSPVEGDNRNVTAHWGVDFARMSRVCPQTLTISKSCLFSPSVLFLFISGFFFLFCQLRRWGKFSFLLISWS